MPLPSSQSQSSSTQRGSNQVLGGLMVCELTRQEGDQTEIMCRDDSQKSDTTNGLTHSGTDFGTKKLGAEQIDAATDTTLGTTVEFMIS